MHTRIDLLLCNESESAMRILTSRIYDEIKRLEKMANYFDPASELAEVNQLASKEKVQVNEELFHIISLCKDYTIKTQGYFDISIHSDNYTLSTINSVLLDPQDFTIFFDKKGIKLNLSGFLKGYALDKIKEVLVENGVFNALINLGNSSVMVLGNHPYGEGWKIDLAIPSLEKEKDIVLFNECFTTSGNGTTSRKHIINPSTGEYIEGKNSISVITENGTDGEVLSTVLFILTSEERSEEVYQEYLKQFFNYRIIG